MSEVNLQALSDEEFETHYWEVDREQSRRTTLRTLPGKMSDLNKQYLTSSGISEGEEWRQPSGGHDSYPQGWTVLHGGKQWVSLTPANVWEPGVSGWREVLVGTVPEWVSPTGAHDAYNVGDRVRFNDQVFVSLIDANTWSPSDYPQGWEVVTDE